MANAQWCSIIDFTEQVPELKNDIEVGGISAEEISRYIERGTMKVKYDIQNRYDIKLYADTPDSIPQSLRTYTAVESALVALQARQVGEAATKREVGLLRESYYWREKAVNGALLADDNSVIANSESTLIGDESTLPEILKDIYATGSRFGVENAAIGINSHERVQ